MPQEFRRMLSCIGRHPDKPLEVCLDAYMANVGDDILLLPAESTKDKQDSWSARGCEVRSECESLILDGRTSLYSETMLASSTRYHLNENEDRTQFRVRFKRGFEDIFMRCMAQMSREYKNVGRNARFSLRLRYGLEVSSDDIRSVCDKCATAKDSLSLLTSIHRQVGTCYERLDRLVASEAEKERKKDEQEREERNRQRAERAGMYGGRQQSTIPAGISTGKQGAINALFDKWEAEKSEDDRALLPPISEIIRAYQEEG